MFRIIGSFFNADLVEEISRTRFPCTIVHGEFSDSSEKSVIVDYPTGKYYSRSVRAFYLEGTSWTDLITFKGTPDSLRTASVEIFRRILTRRCEERLAGKKVARRLIKSRTPFPVMDLAKEIERERSRRVGDRVKIKDHGLRLRQKEPEW